MKATDHTFQIKQSFCGMCVSQAAQQIFKKLLFVWKVAEGKDIKWEKCGCHFRNANLEEIYLHITVRYRRAIVMA